MNHLIYFTKKNIEWTNDQTKVRELLKIMFI